MPVKILLSPCSRQQYQAIKLNVTGIVQLLYNTPDYSICGGAFQKSVIIFFFFFLNYGVHRACVIRLCSFTSSYHHMTCIYEPSNEIAAGSNGVAFSYVLNWRISTSRIQYLIMMIGTGMIKEDNTKMHSHTGKLRQLKWKKRKETERYTLRPITE